MNLPLHAFKGIYDDTCQIGRWYLHLEMMICTSDRFGLMLNLLEWLQQVIRRKIVWTLHESYEKNFFMWTDSHSNHKLVIQRKIVWALCNSSESNFFMLTDSQWNSTRFFHGRTNLFVNLQIVLHVQLFSTWAAFFVCIKLLLQIGSVFSGVIVLCSWKNFGTGNAWNPHVKQVLLFSRATVFMLEVARVFAYLNKFCTYCSAFRC